MYHEWGFFPSLSLETIRKKGYRSDNSSDNKSI